MGADATAQLLGALMPLMVGIVCGVDVEAEAEATCLTALLGAPSRRIAYSARIVTLWGLGALALILALLTFSAPLVLLGRTTLGPVVLLGAALSAAFGSIPLYLVLHLVALARGRNAAIVVGAAGLLLAVLSVGGLAHGLVTGELTATRLTALSFVPTSWPVLLGSLAIESAIAGGGGHTSEVAASARVLAGACGCTIAFLVPVADTFIRRFEDGRSYA